MSVTVRTKEELERAINNKEDEIIIEGELAEKVKKVEALKKLGPIAMAIVVAAVAAIPVTGGLSSGFVAAVAATAGVSPTVIIAIVVLGVTLMYAIRRDYRITFTINENGIPVVILERKEKKDSSE